MFLDRAGGNAETRRNHLLLDIFDTIEDEDRARPHRQFAKRADDLRHDALCSHDTLGIEEIDALPIELMHHIGLVGADLAMSRAVPQQIGGDLKDIAGVQATLPRIAAEQARERLLRQILRFGPVANALEEERNKRWPPAPDLNVNLQAPFAKQDALPHCGHFQA